MVNASIQIKVADAQEIETLSRIIRLAYMEVAERFGLNAENCPKHPSNCTGQWITGDLDRGVSYYLLEVFGQAAGCAALEAAKDAMCYLERVAVLPEYKRQGLGRKLVVHLLREAGRLGMKEVGIGIIAEQQELMRWYQRIGFKKGKIKSFKHLPFEVMFMTYRVQSSAFKD